MEKKTAVAEISILPVVQLTGGQLRVTTQSGHLVSLGPLFNQHPIRRPTAQQAPWETPKLIPDIRT